MDFYNICTKETKTGYELYPDFLVGRSKDLMVRGNAFYAIWDEKAGMWSTDEYDVQRLVDEEIRAVAEKADGMYSPKYMRSHTSGSWSRFKQYIKLISDNATQLDNNLTFANTEVKKSDYVSRRLPYSLEPGDITAWDELVGTLYSVEERAKIEWIIGAIVSGDSKKIQKFGVFYGPPGKGKGTILEIVERLFPGYVASFDAKALGSNGSDFATEAFKENPLVAIQQDGDLSRIEDNTRLNSIISHENMMMNEKYKASYTSRVNAFLLMGTNQPVKISDAKSGIIRRLIDINPTGVTIPKDKYDVLMQQINFELGAIAHHCLEVYRRMGKNYYNGYRPLEMMFQTDVFFNFVEANYSVFKKQDGCSLKQAYLLYKEYCDETGIPVNRWLPQYKVREELRNYFNEFHDRVEIDGETVRSYYKGFNTAHFKEPKKEEPTAYTLVVKETTSLLDELLANQPAQLTTKEGTPKRRWSSVETTLSDIDTTQLHYVKVPENHIVIDFDLKDENGTKALDRNLEAAAVWPPTYAEISQGGGGVHLHYTYSGNVAELSASYSDGIEVKTLLGESSLRRRLSRCNDVPVATLHEGSLPKKEKKVLSEKTISSEKGLRQFIERNLRKEIHAFTKPSLDFIKKALDDAYASGMQFDVSDMKPRIMYFAASSSNQAEQCLKIYQQMVWKSEETPADKALDSEDRPLVIFDVESYPNLFVICWKYRGSDEIVRMVNPSAEEVLALFKMRLVGFYNRRYDNHMLYAAALGWTVEELYDLSQRIVVQNSKNAMFGEAYNLSYLDIWEMASIKKPLKKWEIDLGIHHMEMDIPWDQPVPDDRIQDVVDYCCNDVLATEAVLDDREGDYRARQILAELSGLSINDTTQAHAARILFGTDRRPQDKFVYTDLSKEFPGYTFDAAKKPKSQYRGEDPSEGGYVYAEPGIYSNVAVLDVASMHPTSIVNLNLFGPYTKNFADIKDARVAIKHKDFDRAAELFEGRLEPFLRDKTDEWDLAGAKDLSDALKIVINIVYGMTSASFDNPFRDKWNVDNIVAKRGALFMIDLKNFVQERGFTVAHIKTDSIKIPDATPEIIREVMLFGEKYGYEFEHETTYDKFCLVNDAVYIARKGDEWDAVGAQFQHPYVFKTLFTGETPDFQDLQEPKSVQKGAMYLDFEYDVPWESVDRMQFIGRTGLFIPVKEDHGGVLYRVYEGKPYAVGGTKGYYWVEAEMYDEVTHEVDMSYFLNLAENAYKTIEKFGRFEELKE